MLIERHAMPAHLTTCPHNPIPCIYCSKDVSGKRMKKHLLHYCTEIISKCLYCNVFEGKKVKKEKHERKCPLAPIVCQVNGCNHQCERKNINLHYQKEAVNHINLLLRQIESFENKNDSKKQKLSNENNEIESNV